MNKFKVGQEYVVLDPVHLGTDSYNVGDTFTIAKVVYGDTAQDDSEYEYWFNSSSIRDGYIKLIKDVPEEQPKLTPRDLACFEEVAKVIGEEGAEKELQEVLDTKPDIIGGDFDKLLGYSFDWDESPQGYEFWCLIDDNILPKGYVHESSIPTMKETVEDLEGEREEYTGSSVSYYTVTLENGNEVECNDIIEALGMSYAEGNAFKAIWRKCAAQSLGKSKKGYDNGLYDSEKVVFFGERMVIQEKRKLED